MIKSALVKTLFLRYADDFVLVFQSLSRLGLDLEAREALNSVQRQVEVVKQSAERVSSSAEVYGAVQQVNLGVSNLVKQMKYIFFYF